MSQKPPPHVEAAAATVQSWLDGEQKPTPLSDEAYNKLTPAEKLDYVHRFDQSTMPEWKDPRPAQTEQQRRFGRG